MRRRSPSISSVQMMIKAIQRCLTRRMRDATSLSTPTAETDQSVTSAIRTARRRHQTLTETWTVGTTWTALGSLMDTTQTLTAVRSTGTVVGAGGATSSVTGSSCTSLARCSATIQTGSTVETGLRVTSA